MFLIPVSASLFHLIVIGSLIRALQTEGNDSKDMQRATKKEIHKL